MVPWPARPWRRCRKRLSDSSRKTTKKNNSIADRSQSHKPSTEKYCKNLFPPFPCVGQPVTDANHGCGRRFQQPQRRGVAQRSIVNVESFECMRGLALAFLWDDAVRLLVFIFQISWEMCVRSKRTKHRLMATRSDNRPTAHALIGGRSWRRVRRQKCPSQRAHCTKLDLIVAELPHVSKRPFYVLATNQRRSSVTVATYAECLCTGVCLCRFFGFEPCFVATTCDPVLALNVRDEGKVLEDGIYG